MDTIQLGAHVNTNLGEGFVILRAVTSGKPAKGTKDVQPVWGVRLMDGTIRHSFPVQAHPNAPLLTEVTLINNYPVDHKMAPKGLRNWISDHMPHSRAA